VSSEPFHPAFCFADLQYVDGLGELADAPGLELGVRALAG
jgi:hypothetical protein